MSIIKLPSLQKLLLAFAFAIISVAAGAQETGALALSSLNSLESFVKNTKSGRAAFTQVVTSPAKDGQTLWLHDVDLNQVTARKLVQVLNGTPAAVIAAAADLKGLQADFVLVALPEKAGLRWVQAVPKTKEGQLQSITVGIRTTDKGTELAALEILDSFGQLSVMTFSQFEVNPALAAAGFQFKPPAGADVSRQ